MSKSCSLPFLGILCLALTLFAILNPSGAYAQTPSSELVIQEEKAACIPENGTQPSQTDNRSELNIAPSAPNGTEEQEREDERDIMESALGLLDSSQDCWVKGDLENALELLDQAYFLLLDTNGDPDISRQKDDLRLLIAKRILAIYTSMQTVTTGKRGEIPIIINSDVEKEIRSFQTVEKDFFIQSYQRSAMYRSVILKELKNAGLPEELAWLPLVESGFKVCALSRARALGLWQFIPSTGYKYGLNRDDWIDERMDVEKSTKAAIGYLKELHGMFGDWLTVLAAYNCGEGRVLKVISGQHLNYLDRFWDLYHRLPYETARYVPRFLATLHIIKDPQKYGIELGESVDKQIAPPYEIVKTSKAMRLQDIAQNVNTSEDVLSALNPELRYRATPDREYDLHVPPEMAEKLSSAVNDIPEWEKPQPVRASKSSYRSISLKHRVKRGETVASIARRYHTSVGAILTSNHLSRKKGVRIGQYLIIPVRSSRYAMRAASEDPGDESGSVTKPRGEVIKYTVKRGDTLRSVANDFGTTSLAIKRINKLKGNKLRFGQVIKIAHARGSGDEDTDRTSVSPNRKAGKTKKIASHKKGSVTKTYRVKKGDSLNKIARTNNVSLDKLMELNKFANEDAIRPGQIIVVK